MQTSFMHPPFGFALFYLRGIAPKEVKTSDIYMGALPWVLLQIAMVVIVIFWPGLVTSWLDKEEKIDVDKVRIEVPVAPEPFSEPPPIPGLEEGKNNPPIPADPPAGSK
jgi:hypothetical protein